MACTESLSLIFQIGPYEWQRQQFVLVNRVPRGGKMGIALVKLAIVCAPVIM